MQVGDILTSVNNIPITKVTNIQMINEMVVKSGDKIKLTLNSRPPQLGKQIHFSYIIKHLPIN